MTDFESGDDALLTSEMIRELLNELGNELAAVGELGELFVVGGAALALAYGGRESTHDIDALFEPKLEMYAAAARVARRRGLPDQWLNDAMKGFLHGDDPDRTLVFEHSALAVYVASPRYLLAMKLLSARIERDADDIALLLRLCAITDVDEALDLVEAAYGPSRLTMKTQLLVEAILDDTPNKVDS